MNSIEKKIPQKILEFLIQENILPHYTLIVALSGGPDSTALLHALNLNREYFKCTIKAAYVNHGMRSEEQLLKDDEFVRDFTSQINVELFSLHVEPGEIAKISSKEGRSSEEVARSYRYGFFENILSKYENSYLILGHNRDDQYETLISRYFQGSGIGGLKGIPHRNKNILRPLIFCRKKEILQYLSLSEQTFRIDPTNEENDFLRNKIRNRLIPLIEEIFPGYAKSLNTQEERFLSLEDLIESEADQILCNYKIGSCSVLLDSFNSSHAQIRSKLLYQMFDHCYRGGLQGFRVPGRFFQSLIFNELEKNRVYAKSYGINIQSDDRSLIFSVLDNQEEGFFYSISDQDIEVPDKFYITLGNPDSIKIESVSDSSLIVRSKVLGDSIELKDKRESIKNIFKRWSVRAEDKNLIPLVVDSSGIIAVLGKPFGYKNIFRNKKKMLSQKNNILYLEVGKILQK